MKKTPTSVPNPQQQQAIHTTEGPLLIIAGPGSGKTFTLVERIYHLISEKGIPTRAAIRLNLHGESRRRTHHPGLVKTVG